MDWLTPENFTPVVIILLIIMVIFVSVAFFSAKISKLINRKYQGDFSNSIKLISMVVIAFLSVAVILIIRG